MRPSVVFGGVCSVERWKWPAAEMIDRDALAEFERKAEAAYAALRTEFTWSCTRPMSAWTLAMSSFVAMCFTTCASISDLFEGDLLGHEEIVRAEPLSLSGAYKVSASRPSRASRE